MEMTFKKTDAFHAKIRTEKKLEDLKIDVLVGL